MKRTFRATASRDGRSWFIQVPDDKALFTQVRRLDQAERMIREVIGLMLEVPEDSFEVIIEPQMESMGNLRVAIEDALRARQAAEEAQ